MFRKEKEGCSFRFGTSLEHLGCVAVRSAMVVLCLFQRLRFADQNADTNHSFRFLFQAVLADLSTLKVMPLLQIFLFATVT